MSEKLRVEFKVAVAPEPKPGSEPGARIERQRQNRAARRARNLALAYWIEGLVRSGEVADLAAVARICGVSRARVSTAMGFLEMGTAELEELLCPPA